VSNFPLGGVYICVRDFGKAIDKASYIYYNKTKIREKEMAR
jgi:hypothetical protein